jgi:pimeloyl-ACP methyl ester carboxylesterase
MMLFLRFLFRVLQLVAPSRAAAWAERVFFTAPRTRLTHAQREQLELARPISLVVHGRRIAAWTWGDGPIVYLVHGWGSRGARLAAFVRPLVDAGFQVVTFDGPGHGASEGRLSSMPEFARALQALVTAVGPAHGVIAHSLGASAATLAMHWGVPVERAVFVAPAADPVGYTLRWAGMLGLRPSIVAAMRAQSERRLAFRWDDLNVPAMAGGRRVPLLVFHDAGDTVVPPEDGRAIAAAWPGARMVTTTGLGHRDIVRAAEIVKEAAAFLAGEGLPLAATVPPPRGEAHWIERHLFERERRPHLVASVRA